MALSSNRRKKLRRALAVIAWLLLLGFISYCLFLPDLEEVSRKLKAIREDPNLTLEEKFEKSREVYSSLTPGQGRQVFQNDIKKMHYERNAEMQKFLKMSPEEQVAYVKKQAEERKQFGPKELRGFAIKAPPGGGRGGVVMADKGGPGGGKGVYFGPPGGGSVHKGPPGGGPPNPSQMQKNMLDNFSPETRAGQSYQKGLSE
jgi:hypothetical protein